ncbi:beta-glucosidase [Vibrio sp. S17_S38]|uniref:glycoside hydrolase family 3 N-terminal domain-containing protein n=1 Tax=Vibrio sp. S17_S38 TaxID=2720229 RepID=UPI00168063BB|nr:glycoside hydrolase family 3 N-terminal domain-containing protein [Vibrio sp. S17_S38]MBD1572624.1 beta-glucosidase [Vibrio sp. S17_S38]
MSIYKDSNYTVNERLNDLLSQMTIDEKIAQLGAQWLILEPDGEHQDRELEMGGQDARKPIKERLRHGLGQITRPLGTHSVDASVGIKALNQLQKYLIEETRLGIPAMSHEECLVGLMAKGATLFPSSLNFGHTWNPELIEQMSAEIGHQARKVGAHHGLAPVLDVSRDVRWGRTEETLGEDPYHAGILATHYVKGLQGENRDLLATLKHYVGHSFSEGARNHAPVHLGYKELNDSFMLPFEMAVKLANAGSVMPAYHDIDNEACHASSYLLTTVLREQWGFDGLIVADYGGVELLASHHGIAANNAEAAALAFNAGLDIELPDDACSRHLKVALDEGLISESKIDEIVSRILKVKFELGLFEHPYCDESNTDLRSDRATELAYQVALQSIVLLENDGTLPLNSRCKIAVVGPTANDQLALLGGYSFPVHLILSSFEDDTKVAKTLLEAVQDQFEDVIYSKGCEILTQRHTNAPVFPGDVDMATGQQLESPVSQDANLIPKAVAAIDESDVALVCVGDLAGLFQTGTVGEGSDTDSLNLPGVQQQLIDAALATNKPVIILVTGGRSYNLNGAEEKAAAVIFGWAPGQEGARAIVDIMTGNQSPSGRLTLSIPKNVGAVPYYYNHKLKSGGTPIAYHFGSKYNFGYGLTYSQFDYQNMRVEQSRVEMGGRIKVQVDIQNTGQREGCEVMQLYIKDKLCSLVRPVKELKGFQRVNLNAGEHATVWFELPTDMLNFTNNNHQRVVEPGEFEIMVGKSSTDILLSETITVTGKDKVLDKYWNMVCHSGY